jgi:cytoskeletal protein RodZ
LNKLGELLKNERIRQGLEIKDIENAISVRELYLRAIEDGNHKIVPGEVYLKGFIRNYAIQLGLDPQEALKVYQQDKEPEEEPKTFNGQPAQPVQPVPLMAKAEEQSTKPRKYQRRDRREEKKEPILGGWGKWVLILLLLAGAAVWGGALNVFNLPFSAAPPDKEPTQTEAKNPAPEDAANQGRNSGQAASPTETTAVVKGVTVAIKFNGKCWTQVIIDNKPEYAGIPKVGETLTFSGNERIFVKVGNAGAVDVTHNNKAVGSLGAPGSVVERIFYKDR